MARIAALTIVMEKGISDDDAQALMCAMRQFRGVRSVSPDAMESRVAALEARLKELEAAKAPAISSVETVVPIPSTATHINTEQFAALNGVRAQSVRKRYCQTGDYFGIVPAKLSSGRLSWPVTQARKY